jgi:dTDP-4-amino-4,6-dideoxygalactose transaminase
MIPVFKPLISKQGINEVIATLTSGWCGQGPRAQEFEKRFAEFVGAKYAVSTNSCTAAFVKK